ncbi:hypothetical protein BGW39_009176 [Mortierella sp. 14UC]|nr:hypothetical protein BGW39_009176 [Mortierella sp. 14UC]
MSEFMRGLQAFERLVKSDEGVRTGSCGKCGGSGHLTYECRNLIKLDAPAAKPKANSRFGFLRKQLPAAASPTTGSESPVAGGAGADKKADSRSNKDTKSTSSRHNKKRRGSVNSDSDSDSRSDSDEADSASSSGSEEGEHKRRKRTHRSSKEPSSRHAYSQVITSSPPLIFPFTHSFVKT